MLGDPIYDSEEEGPHHHLRQTQEQQQQQPLQFLGETLDGPPHSPLSNSNSTSTAPKRLRLKIKSAEPDRIPSQEPIDYDIERPGQFDMVPPRRSTRISSTTQASGSEYSAQGGGSVSSRSEDDRSRRTRSHKIPQHDDDDDDEFDAFRPTEPKMATYVSRGGRKINLKNPHSMIESDDDDEEHPIRAAGTRKLPSRAAASHRRRDSFLDDDGEDHDDDDDDGSQTYNTRAKSKQRDGGADKGRVGVKKSDPDAKLNGPTPASQREQRLVKRRSARQVEEETDYVDDGPSHSSIDMDADGSVEHDDPVPSEPEEPPQRSLTPEETRGYGLRKRTTKVNYTLPPPLAPDEIGPHINGASTGGVNGFIGEGRGKGKGPAHKHFRHVQPWGLGARFGAPGGPGEFGKFPAKPADDSDSDGPNQTPRRPSIAAAGGASTGLYNAGASFNELAAAAAGTPSNLGKIGTDSALADADPLGVNSNVTFDEVGGLDDHITSLKEMVSLPLLYPEVFQQFNVTPPRGVLFHGPPGTGKTLVARALAASSRSGGKGISFFMRKGADCLSKWVGEAERQLRLLFDEAKACQPSIIFFDEIDGLAPVRSSKQDQIHASIVSTLLALMDGMDGRGQVIVIGATNRPDAIDPALRRPGRFDREFYFPLPSLPARQKILSILTKNWGGWEGEKGDETRAMLAKSTKGYGGADLRALVTEAALNAVQRRYPQIYTSSDRLLLRPETIQVQARDFMIAIQKMVPSSARSMASEAKPLPTQLVPLLGESLETVKSALDKAFPQNPKRTALEEAMYEEDEETGGLEREMMLQAMDTLRVHRPRLAIHGAPGLGQAYVGAAALHHLEGVHVQSLDLGTLMSDSTRTPEAAIVQLFIEAKRHKPSIVYIPSIIGWCAAISETARTTVRAMLDSLSPTDPLLLLAVVDGEFSQLPRDVRAWFGHNAQSRVLLSKPSLAKREAFFKDLLDHVRRYPSQFPDAFKRKKRVLEVLPVAPPLPPKQPTAAEVAAQAENDERLKAMLTHRLGPVLQDLKKKFKRFTKSVRAEYDLDDDPGDVPEWAPPPVESQGENQPIAMPNGVINVDGDADMANGAMEQPGPPPIPRHKQYFDIDLEKMHAKLYYEGYLTPKDFLEDIAKIVANSEVEPIDNERLFKAQAMYHATNASLLSWEPQFAIECERMSQREVERRKEREQRRLEKGKGRITEHESLRATPERPYAPGTRRSARANGLGPELAFTPDPERKLKRLRSQGGSGESQGSDVEMDGQRSPKRAKTASDEEREIPNAGTAMAEPASELPLEGAPKATTPPENDGHSPGRSARFANTLGLPEHDAMSLLNICDQGHMGPIPPRQLTAPPGGGSGSVTPGPIAASPSVIHREFSPLLGNQFPGEPQLTTIPMVAGPTPSGSFEPIKPIPVVHFVDDPFSSSSELSAPINPIPPPVEAQPIQLDAVMLEPTDERQPSPSPPPPPDFHLDPVLEAELSSKLLDRTTEFNVEQLEQLRASCLGSVWNHRSDWDRDDLIRELITVIDDYAGEVAMDWDTGTP
ncbi:hypothetical protein FRB93_007498 [Tulasnella sp. JGI-2019a]|nr:hypothetical protein FRB93_007498 [Tulasnella sp. JGI-2019a]